MGRPRQDTCRNGHDLTDPANVLTKRNGDRQCRPCHRAAKNAWHRRTYGAKREALGLPERPPRIDREDCEVESCDRPRFAHGPQSRSRYCSAHYHRLRDHGDLYEDVPVGSAHGRPGLAGARRRLASQQ